MSHQEYFWCFLNGYDHILPPPLPSTWPQSIFQHTVIKTELQVAALRAGRISNGITTL